jgi:flagellar motor switch protein FliN/FliY
MSDKKEPGAGPGPKQDRPSDRLTIDDVAPPQLARKLRGGTAVASAPPNLTEEPATEGDALPDTTAGLNADAVDAFAAMAKSADSAHFDVVMDIPLRMAVEVGRADISIRHLVQLGHGSLVELDRPAAAPLDIRVNGVLVARGEVVVVNDEKMGVRVTDVVAQAERLKRLR